MPRYEYTCKKCGDFEEEHKLSEKLEECPKCKSEVERLISKTSFQLKGNGWASDGYSTTKH